MSNLRHVAKEYVGRALRYQAGHRVQKVQELSEPLAAALAETLRRDLTVEEGAWIDEIEALRDELSVSRREVAITDYGAGKPALALSGDEMAKGRVVRRSIGDVCIGASKSRFWSLLLFKIIRKFKPSLCLELGTCLGISASYQAAAMKLNGSGDIVSLEGAPSLASLASEHLSRLGLDNATVVVGRFQETLAEVLASHGRFDYVFIDGHHDEQATLGYFKEISPRLSGRAVVVLDDISWSAGMRRAWDTVVGDHRIGVALDLRQIGVCLMEPTVSGRQMLSIPLV